MEKMPINHEDPRLKTSLTEEHKEHIRDVADNRGISMAALCRKWLAAGERAEAAVIPDFDDPESTHSAVQKPAEQLILNEMPDNAGEAISIDDLREKMQKKIDKQVMDLYRESDDIGVTDGGDVYADD